MLNRAQNSLSPVSFSPGGLSTDGPKSHGLCTDGFDIFI